MCNYDYDNLKKSSLRFLNDLENHVPSTTLNYLISQEENYDCDYVCIDKQIPINELQIGHWYGGKGRCAIEGRWDGDSFSVIGTKGSPISWEPRKWVNMPQIRGESYYTKNSGTFQPLFRISDEDKLAELSLVFNNVSAIEFDTILFLKVKLEFHKTLDAIFDGIKHGKHKREDLVKFAKNNYGIPRKKVLYALDQYTGVNLDQRSLWRVKNCENTKLYFILKPENFSIDNYENAKKTDMIPYTNQDNSLNIEQRRDE